MANEKPKDAFSKLLSDMDNIKPLDPAELNFKNLVTEKTKRILERAELSGFAMIYNDTGEFLVKAVLRNISLGGFGLEVPDSKIQQGDKLRVMLAGVGVQLGSVPCIAKWVGVLKRPDGGQNLLIGLEITKKTQQFMDVYDKFVNAVMNKKHTTNKRRINVGRSEN